MGHRPSRCIHTTEPRENSFAEFIISTASNLVQVGPTVHGCMDGRGCMVWGPALLASSSFPLVETRASPGLHQRRPGKGRFCKVLSDPYRTCQLPACAVSRLYQTRYSSSYCNSYLSNTGWEAAAWSVRSCMQQQCSSSAWSVRSCMQSPKSKDSLLQWLPNYGHHVTRLQLAYLAPPLQQLPCPNLLDLQLASCSVQLGAADGFPGVVQGCSKLTRLELECIIIDLPQDGVLDSLSSLVHLQHFHVEPTNAPTAGLSSATLPRLQHLTYLQTERLSVENLLQLSCLTNLQALHVLGAGEIASDIVVGPSRVPCLVFPSSLQVLTIKQSCESAVFSLVPTGLQKLEVICHVDGPADGPGSFLSGIARLQRLTELVIKECEGLALAPAGPTYSALTASSNLVALDLIGVVLPLVTWPHILSATRRLQHLTSLWLQPVVDEFGKPTPMGAAELSCLVSCCPSLCDVTSPSRHSGPAAWAHWLHVSELHKLTALTCV